MRIELDAYDRRIQALLHNGANAVIGFAGNAASIENNRAAADSFLASLPMAEVVPQTYDLPVPASAEGIVINSTVNFNLVYATFEQMGVEGGYSGAMDAMCSLVSDGLLYPLLRDQYGAYGVFHGAVVGHFRNGPYDLSDVRIDDASLLSRKEEIIAAVQTVNFGALPQRFMGGKP